MSLDLSVAGIARRDWRPSLALLLGALGLTLTAAVLLALSSGSIAVPLDRTLSHLAYVVGLPGEALSTRDLAVLMTLRLPRILLAVAVGVTLGVAGASLQAIFRNPLADPGLVGVSSGAACAGSFTMVLGVSGLGLAAGSLSLAVVLPVAAFLGALIATGLVLLLARRDGRCSAADMLLAGIAINALGVTGIGLCSYIGDDQALRQMTFWMMGGFSGAAWGQAGPAVLLMILATIGLMVNARRLDLYALGERDAFLLGLNPHRFAVQTVLLVALGVGAAVSVSGLIGFVGLVVPHMIRLWLGPAHRRLLPATALTAATLMILADTVARTLAAPADIPVGLLLGAVGAPVFLWLLRSRTAGTAL